MVILIWETVSPMARTRVGCLSCRKTRVMGTSEIFHEMESLKRTASEKKRARRLNWVTQQR